MESAHRCGTLFYQSKACELTNWNQWLYLDTLATACAAAEEFTLAAQWEAKALKRAPPQYHPELQGRLDLYARKRTHSGKALGISNRGSGQGGRPHQPEPSSKHSLSPEEGQYVTRVRELLQLGLSTSRDGYELAQSRYDSARRLRDDDPRLYHAWGLVCLKHSKVAQALRQFELAIRLDGGRYLPAWQGLARTQVQNNAPDEALKNLTRLADVLVKSDKRSLTQSESGQCAAWLGQMLGFIGGQEDNSRRLKAAVKRTDAKLLRLLRDSLRVSYENGKQRAARHHHEMAADAKPPLHLDRGPQVDQMNNGMAFNPPGAIDLDPKLENQLMEFRTRYNELAAALVPLQARATALEDTIARAKTTKNTPMSYIMSLNRQNELTKRQIAEIQRQGALVVRQRNTFLVRHHIQATGSNLLEKPAGGGLEAPAPNLPLDSFLPVDYEMEAQRILRSYSVRPESEQPANAQ